MATIGHSLNSKTETTVTINWNNADIVDYIKYSTDNGANWSGWVNVTDSTSGKYTISGLKPNTTYKIKTLMQSKSTKETVTTSALSVTTYDYPYCTEAPDFTIGEEVRLKFYNPLSRAFLFYVIVDGVDIGIAYSCSSKTYAGIDSKKADSSVERLYRSLPNAEMGYYEIKVDYNGKTKTSGYGAVSVDRKVCSPVFTDFDCVDLVSGVSAITGGNDVFVQNISQPQFQIPQAKKMQVHYSTTPWFYNVRGNGKTININGDFTGTATGNFGTLTKEQNLIIDATAYDNRSLPARVSKEYKVYPYANPVLSVTATRKNNFEAETTLKVSGTYSRVTVADVDKNTISSVQFRCRETGETDWGEWETITIPFDAGKFSGSIKKEFENTKSFEIEVKVADAFSTKVTDVGVTTKKVTLGIGKPVFIVSSNNKTCYMNGKEIALLEDVPTLHKYTNIPDGTDLNTLTTIGVYKSISKAHSDTMANVPSGISGGFRLVVSNWTGNADYTARLRQDLYYFSRQYVRHIQNDEGTWSAWQLVAFLETAHPVGSVYISSENVNPANTLGIGTWSLIGKSFKEGQSNGTNFFSANVDEWCTNAGGYVYRGGNTVRVRQSVKVELAMNDTGMVLGHFNWDEIGVKSIGFNMLELLAHIDGANGGIIYNIAYDTGDVSQVDVLGLDTFPTDKTVYLEFTAVVGKDLMLDAFCDRFYWKRTG